MLLRLLALFIIVPLVELAILIKVGQHIGAAPTVLTVVGVGLFGAWLARHEGWRALRNIQTELSQGRLPGNAALDALLIFAAGVLMITPGLLTDVVGLLLLAPPVRAVVRRWLKRSFQGRLSIMQFGTGSFNRTNDEFIDVESHVRDESEGSGGQGDTKAR